MKNLSRWSVKVPASLLTLLLCAQSALAAVLTAQAPAVGLSADAASAAGAALQVENLTMGGLSLSNHSLQSLSGPSISLAPTVSDSGLRAVPQIPVSLVPAPAVSLPGGINLEPAAAGAVADAPLSGKVAPAQPTAAALKILTTKIADAPTPPEGGGSSVSGQFFDQAAPRHILDELGVREKIIANGGLQRLPGGLLKPLKKPLKLAILDIDGNILNLPTKLYIRHKKTHEEKALTDEEYMTYGPDIGKRGLYQEYETFRAPDGGSYRELRDNLGPDAFPNAIDAMLSSPGPSQARAPSWEFFSGALANPETAPWVGLLTTRGHWQANITRGLSKLVDRSWLKQAPREEMIFPVGVGVGPMDKIFPPDAAPPDKKADILIGLLDLLESIPLEDASAHHDLGFSDNDARMMDRIRARLAHEQLEGGRWPHVKVSLYYTGGKKDKVVIMPLASVAKAVLSARLSRALEQAWSRDTSSDPERWSEKNPAWGQCAVTALIIQEYLGGSLMRAAWHAGSESGSHYWNLLPDGTKLDLTFRQFPPEVQLDAASTRERDYVLGFPATAQRYKLLKERVMQALPVPKKPTASWAQP
jgi:hypothetical protein